MIHNQDFLQTVENAIKRTSDTFYNFKLLSVRLSVNGSFGREVLISIKNKLLEFMIALQAEYGDINIENLKLVNKEITTIMNNSITTHGDGNITTTGDNNTIKAKITIDKRDTSQLIEQLKHHKVQSEDITDLVSIIDSETPISANVFGPKVNSWFGNMMMKAGTGTWDIAIGAAGGVLAEIIGKYYGLV